MNQAKYRRLPVVALVSLCVGLWSATASGGAAASDGAADSAAQTVQDNTKCSAVIDLATLKDLGEICRHIKGTTKDLLYETQRPNQIVVGTPTVIGNMVIPPRPDPSGIVNTGTFLPPRKKWLDYFRNELSFLMPQLQECIGGLAAGEDNSATAAPISDIKKQGEKIADAYGRLGTDIQATQLANNTIARDAEIINLCADRIDKTRKELEKTVKHERKRK
jgi:hypothetical protein